MSDVVDALASTMSHHTTIAREGSKIPRGARVGDEAIAWTHHGVVAGEKFGDTIGYYKRHVEFGGASGKRHEMTISADDIVTPPPGGEVIATSWPTGGAS